MNLAGHALRPFGFSGSWRVSRAIAPLLAERCETVLVDGAPFCFNARDPYWNRLLMAGFVYEPEVARVLRLLKDVDYAFIDCGANYGLWSVLASAPSFGSKRAVA